MKPLPLEFDWAGLAFGSKKVVNQLKAVFIAAPRELSLKRFTQIVKTYLPLGNIVLGLSKDEYVEGLEGQPQFRMLRREDVQSIIDKVNASGSKHRIATLDYHQREINYVLEKLDFKKVVLVNGSWYRAFHLRPEFYTLAHRGLPFEKISPFVDESEARQYVADTQLPPLVQKGTFTETEMLALASQAARQSYDFGGFQIGVTLGRKKGSKFQLVATTHNNVVPFETYAMHYGAAREKHFSPTNDLNYYDTIHAEVALIVKAGQERIDLKGTTLFINLLPCPMCARMFAQTDIAEFIYSHDHSDGYGLKMLELAGKKVRRIV
jgi:deoxycytidylate deaminase